MFHALSAGIVSIGLAASTFIPFLGNVMPKHEGGMSSSTRSEMHESMGSSTRPAFTNKDGFRNATSTSALSATAIACVSTAVTTREQALGTGVTSYTSSVSSAYATRASALSSAYTGASADIIRPAVKSAWTAFSSSVSTAKKAWKTAQQSAWKDFKTAVALCGTGATSVADTSGATLDIMGAE